MKHAGKTDIGMHRKNNQDSFAVFSGNGYLCAIVCDGMGGAKGGNIASGLAVKTFASSIRRSFEKIPADDHSPQDVRSLLEVSLEKANKAVYEKSLSDEELDGMGTTLVSVIICNSGSFAVNVGDSRLYTQYQGTLEQISEDHSFVQYLLKKGDITSEEALVHPNRNIILRAVGVAEKVAGDYFTLGEYDDILLCTDGLTNHVPDARIAGIIEGGAEVFGGRKATVRAKVDKLVEEANANGGSDNITAVLIEM